jgi:ABC-type bacteriocin/lantibiotic exporter with double-glycine peptidase domain
MPDGGSLRGLGPEIALWRLLALRGIDIPLAQLREEARIDESLESMQVALSPHGIHARGVRIEGAREIATLETPTLLQQADGTWVLLRACRRGRGVVETADGVSDIPLRDVYRRSTGQALELTPGLPEGRGLWPRMRALLSAHRGILLQFALASLALQSLALMTPELTGQVMGKALPDSAVGLLRLVASAVVAVAVFTGAVTWLRERIVLYLLTRLELSIKRGLLEHVLHLPFPQLQARSLGDLLQAFYGIASARALLAEKLFGALIDGMLALGFLVLMGVKILAATLVLLSVMLVMVCVAWLVGRAQARVQDAEVAAQALQRGYLTEIIAGIRTIKAAGAERACHDQWLRRFDSELSLALRRNRIGLWNEVGLQATRQASSTTMLLWGGYLVLQGEIGIGTLFSFVLLAEGFLAAMQNLINTYLVFAVVSRQLVGADALLALDRLPSAQTAYRGTLNGPIMMKGVWFRYSNDGPWILQDHDLRIEPGAKYQISGPSGCGKSTILRLIAGLYAPERGTITIGGREIGESAARMLYLPQFIHLNAGSIMDNLRNLSGNASPRDLMEAAAKTGFDKVVASMAMGYHTLLPHGGHSLSGGQRQLLALTAALAADCDLLLLDEPMANIDALTQTRLAETLAAHRCSIISVGHV